MRPFGEILADIANNVTIQQAELDYLRGLSNNIEQNAAMTGGWVTGNPSQISNASLLAGSGNSLLDDQGLRIYNGPTLTGWWQIDGTLRTGSNLAAANTTSFAVFPNLTTYNGESMPIGTVLMGSNSSGFSNIRYDPSTGQLEFRGGTTVQAYVGTDGVIYAGAGDVKLYSDGISLIVHEGIYGKSINFNNESGGTLGRIIGTIDTGQFQLDIGSVAESATSQVALKSYTNGTGLGFADIVLYTCYQETGSSITYRSDAAGSTLFIGATLGMKLNGGQAINEFSIDTTCAGNSNTAVPTEAVLVAYTAAQIAAIPPSGGGGNMSRSFIGL
jgi:hypothetical protein